MTTAHQPADVPALAPRDQEAIARTLTSLLAGFSERNAGKAIEALSPVVAALNQTAIGRLRAMERGRNNGTPDDVNITNRQ